MWTWMMLPEMVGSNLMMDMPSTVGLAVRPPPVGAKSLILVVVAEAMPTQEQMAKTPTSSVCENIARSFRGSGAASPQWRRGLPQGGRRNVTGVGGGRNVGPG